MKKKYMALSDDMSGMVYIYDAQLFKSGQWRVVRDVKTLDNGAVVEDLPEEFLEEAEVEPEVVSHTLTLKGKK